MNARRASYSAESALTYRAAIRRLDERWHAGERSPTRTSKAGEGAP